MLSFIWPWIAFNHCYGLLWSNRRQTLKGEGRKAVRLYSLSSQLLEVGLHERVSDSFKIALFIGEQNHGFPEFWKAFSDDLARSFDRTVQLPIIDLERNEDIPDSTSRSIKLLELEVPTLFRILLTIRNNLFHGGKRTAKRRHLDVCSCAAEFMVPFVTDLTANIEGV
jgi:hypothetical protein